MQGCFTALQKSAVGLANLVIQSLRAFRWARALGSGRGDLEEFDWVPKGRGLGDQGGCSKGLVGIRVLGGRGGSTWAQGSILGPFWEPKSTNKWAKN